MQVPYTQCGTFILDTNLINIGYVHTSDHLMRAASSAEHTSLRRTSLAVIPFHDDVYTGNSLLSPLNQPLA